MTAIAPPDTISPIRSPQAALRARIGWLCHLIRLGAVGWPAWNLGLLFWQWHWRDLAKITENLGRALNADLHGLSYSQIDLAFVLVLCQVAFQAAVSYCIWRLFGSFLQGRIFTVDAAIWMRRIGITELVAVLVSLVLRRVTVFILTSHAHLPATTVLSFGQPVVPLDLIQVMFCFFVIGLAQIFKTAAEMADDHARIV
ncbi:MAG TPA: DUF2975 domain-containing protein [Xanthobacteraceae bacterium]|nr:DUF2975 domain-containing protein [Xanthobacteraceae bacterium]